MNRQSILADIRRHLSDSLAETGEERPLGEIVSRIASELRSGSGSVAVTPARVISIEKVAAFVDGQLELAEADLICDAVMVDNSVLAEIVAAVRATQVSADRLPPLSASLSSRLLAMNELSATGSTVRFSPPTNGHAVDHTLVSEIVVQPARKTAVLKSRAQHWQRLQIAAGLLAVAATIVVGIVLLGRQGNTAPERTMVVDNDAVPLEFPSLPDEVPDVVAEQKDLSPTDPLRSIVETETPAPQPDVDASPPDVPDSNSAVAAMTPPSEAIVQQRAPSLPPEINPRLDSSPRESYPAAPRLTDFRWTEVSGLLAQRSDSSEPSGSRRAATWRPIAEGSIAEGSTASASSTQPRKVALRTLPFSRANGEFVTGGRIVMAGDTGLQITRGSDDSSAELDLMYGSVAMVDLAEGTIIKLQQGDRTFATLRWQSKASAVVHRQASGLQVQVDGGKIAVNDQTVDEESVRIANDRTVETVRAPKRLPKWIARPEESSAVERMILSQLADADDLAAALDQKIDSLASSPRLSRDETLAMAKLSNWQAAMSESNLFRLAGSRVPATRLAALQRLVQLHESDPRYERTWMAIERAVNHPQRVAQIRGWFRLIRNGSRPNAIQLEQMLSGLSSRDFAGRVMSDFMLRQFVRNPPPFDPSWSGQTLQRAVITYRDRAGMPIDRTRAGAAAGVL